MRALLRLAWVCMGAVSIAPLGRADAGARTDATEAAAPAPNPAGGARDKAEHTRDKAAGAKDAAALAAPRGVPEPYKFQPGVICPLCELTPQFPEGRSGLHWHGHWQPVGTREYITVPLLAAGVVALQFFLQRPQEPRWNGPILFDEPVRNALRIGSASGRQTAGNISDFLFVWEVLHPSLIDPLLVAWWKRQSPFVAWQMLMIDAQAYGLTLLLNDLAKNLIARARPWAQTCEATGDADGNCGAGGRNLSFYSGHAAVTATGAGLLCAHHTQLSLYQNDLFDGSTCALAVLGTALTGGLRIASDNHWASDVLIGHLLGYASGYLLPTLLYYKEFRATPHDDHTAPTYAALPFLRRDALGVTVLGAF
jgi:membrane-associated phospholipid phosphatase